MLRIGSLSSLIFGFCSSRSPLMHSDTGYLMHLVRGPSASDYVCGCDSRGMVPGVGYTVGL